MTAPATNDLSAGQRAPSAGWSRPAAVAFVFICALAVFFPLPANSPLAGTEAHRALTAHQMVQSGEWLVPRMFGRVYLAKPPLHYWLIGSFEVISGHANTFIWRLPSTVEGSCLAALLCWLALTWFGDVAGLISGLSYIALITMWGQDRGADIDITNALTATMAAICLLQMQFGNCRRNAGWIILGGLATGASFLTKGPCGLPPILGAMIWIAITRIRQKQGMRLFRPSFWMPLIIGAAIFAIYAYATYHYIHSHHMAADLTGVQEGTEDLHPHDWSISRAVGILILPLIMFVYALPVSVALPFSFIKDVRQTYDADRQSRVSALAWTILLSWAVCFVSGMHLPRYAFVTLPLMCPLAGVIGASIGRYGAKLNLAILAIASVSTVAFGVVVAVLAGMLWKHSYQRPELIGTTLIALPLALIVFRSLMGKKPAWRRLLLLLPIILFCLSLNYGSAADQDRQNRSSLGEGKIIRSITGPNATLYTCMMVLDQPELFYYSGLPTIAKDGDMLDWHDVPSGAWVVLEQPEMEKWKREIPERLSNETPFTANKNAGWLYQYSIPGN
jgi:4-amino-4-deoxy-L-arabinose transferase-like glycosyltransferase